MENNRAQDLGDRWQLRPCPFCGSDAIVWTQAGHAHYLQCYHCGGRIRPHIDKAEAIEAWNRRTTALRLSHVDGAGFGLIGHCHDCGTAVMSSKWKYCPECGATLEWGDED